MYTRTCFHHAQISIYVWVVSNGAVKGDTETKRATVEMWTREFENRQWQRRRARDTIAPTIPAILFSITSSIYNTLPLTKLQFISPVKSSLAHTHPHTSTLTLGFHSIWFVTIARSRVPSSPVPFCVVGCIEAVLDLRLSHSVHFPLFYSLSMRLGAFVTTGCRYYFFPLTNAVEHSYR